MSTTGATLDEQQGRPICVCQILGARGLRGEFFVRAFTADPHGFAQYGPLLNEAGDRLLRLRIVGVTKNGVVARAEGIEDRSAAEALRGMRLYVSRQVLPPAAEDEFYHADLIDLAVVDAGGNALGSVAAVHNFGAGDLIEIKPTQGALTVLLPFTEAAVPVVDLAGKRIVVDAAEFAAAAAPATEPPSEAET
jgi:16S rRNA processing protein RimM